MTRTPQTFTTSEEREAEAIAQMLKRVGWKIKWRPIDDCARFDATMHYSDGSKETMRVSIEIR